MNQNNDAYKIKVQLQYKNYKGCFYYYMYHNNGIERFVAILDKMFCMNYIISSDCQLEIDYDVNEFSCILKDDNGHEYELIDDFTNFNSYVVSSEIVTKNTEFEKSCINYYNFKECKGVQLKVTLNFMAFDVHYFVDIKTEKGTYAFWNANLIRNPVDILVSDCNARISSDKFIFEKSTNKGHPINLSIPLTKLCDYITKLEIIDMIK